MDDPESVAVAAVKGVHKVREQRLQSQDAFFFNWALRVPLDFQRPFHPDPFDIHGDPRVMQALDALLRAFVEQRRMKMVGEYQPCYRVVG